MTKNRQEIESEYACRIMERIIEIDADYISIDHLIEILEDCKKKGDANV